MTLIVTADTGGKTMPISMTVAPPFRSLSRDHFGGMFAGSGLNAVFIAGTLSAFVAHERAGVTLYHVAEEHSENPMVVAKYQEFGRETLQHIVIYEDLITELGGDPAYVSPAARMTEQLGTKLLEGPVLLAGSVDLLSLETACLEAVVIAEHKCRDNWQLLTRLGSLLPEGPDRQAIRVAVAKVEPEEDQHVAWATDMWFQLTEMNAGHEAAVGGMGLIERTVHKVKDALT